MTTDVERIAFEISSLKKRSGTVALTCGERPDAPAAGDTDTLDPLPPKPEPAPALPPPPPRDSERCRFSDCVCCPAIIEPCPCPCIPGVPPIPALFGVGGGK